MKKYGKGIYLKAFAGLLSAVLFMGAGILFEGSTSAAEDILKTYGRHVSEAGDTQTNPISISSSKKWITRTIDADHISYFFQLNITGNSVITLSAKNTLSGEGKISFYKKNGEDISEYKIGGGQSGKYTFYAEQGTYFISYGREQQGDSGEISIKCQCKSLKTPYDTVDNNSFERAVDISSAKKSFGGVLAAEDSGDYYKVSFGSRKLREIKVRNTASDSLKAAFYDEDFECIEQYAIKKGETRSYKMTKTQGILYIELSGAQSGRYTLKPVWNITSKRIKIAGKNINITEGETKRIISGVSPRDASGDSYYIKSKNEKIVGVASNKSITGLKKGKAKVIIYYGRNYDEAGQVFRHKIVCNVTVRKSDIVKIMPAADNIVLEKGEKHACKVKLTPKNADRSYLSYESSNAKVAKVSYKGVITAVSPGKAIIIIRDAGNPKVNAKVRVNISHIIKSVSLSKNDLQLEEGMEAYLTARVSPGGTKYNTVKWSSSNNSAAIVDKSGKVTAVGNGTAVITAVSTENPNAKASCTVIIVKPPADEKDEKEEEQPIRVTGIEISPSGAVVGKDKSVSLTANLTPKGAEGTVSWSIADTSIATISASKNKVTVTGKEFGTTYLTASLSGVKKTVSITVQ